MEAAMCKVIRYDGNRPRQALEGFAPAPGKPCPLYTYEEDENGFPIYEMSRRLAGVVCVARKDRYRLYNSKPFMVKSTTPKGAVIYPTLYPWMYTKVRVEDGEDPVTHEKLFKYRYDWLEGDERNDYSGSTLPKAVHSQVRDAGKPTEDLQAPPPTPPEPRTQPEIMGELKEKLAELLPGGEEDAKVHMHQIRTSLGVSKGGILKAGVFVELVKGMEALIEQFLKTEETEETQTAEE